jgi:uncharacterized protein YciI
MKQYIITGYDYTDDGALDRRMAVRQQHLDGTVALRTTGNYILGGAILDDAGRMIGSVMVVQFETAEELEAWKQSEPYIVHNIWESVDIKPFKVAAQAI